MLYTLKDQGYYNPQATIENAVISALNNRAQQESMDRQQRQFTLEQGVRAANAAPILDPARINAAVQAARLAAQTNAGDVRQMGALPFWARRAAAAGKLPSQTEDTVSHGPNGEEVHSSVTSLPGDPTSDSSQLYTPFSGVQSTTPLPRPSVETSNVAGKGQGYVLFNNQHYTAKDPSQPLLNEDGTLNKANAVLVSSAQNPFRTSRPTVQESIADLLSRDDLPPDVRDQVTLMANKLSSTAPAAPANPGQGRPSEAERLTARIAEVQKQIQTADDDEKPGLQQIATNLTKRLNVLQTAKAPKKSGMEALSELLGTPSQPSQDASGKVSGSDMPAGAASKVAAAKAAQPPASPTTVPNPAAPPAGGPYTPPRTPASTAGKIPAKNTGNWITGKVYKDRNGNPAKWDGDGWLPQ